jgi:translation initiation factor IF-2
VSNGGLEPGVLDAGVVDSAGLQTKLCESGVMSKIRIYELAKELGVDNKIVLARATELGLKGKMSHSHSLDADEADAIRRAVIRQAIGVPKNSNSEVVIARVDRSTGTTEAVVERRQGDVIRRRRHVDAPDSAPGAAAEPVAIVASTESMLTTGAPSAALLEAEALFRTDISSSSEGAGSEGVASGGAGSRGTMSEGGAARALAPELAPEAESQKMLDAENDQAVEGEIPAEPAEVDAESVEAVAGDEADEHTLQGASKKGFGISEPTVEVVSEATLAPTAPAQGGEQKPTIGPKILGRIDLPQRKVIVKPAELPKRVVKPGVPRELGAAPVVVEIEEEGESKKKGFKKGRKREISSVDLVDYSGREVRRSKGGRGHRDEAEERRAAEQFDPNKTKPAKRVIELGDTITVGELAKQMSLKAGEVIGKLLALGIMATINQLIDKDTASILADDLGFEIKHTEFNEENILQDLVVEEPGLQKPRPPVVTVMGHVDHGKTSLLDRIRSAAVAAKEAGGITQHIGAYSVPASKGRNITFIDTPGHAAFTSMRARGAQVTDIVVLVVAADDGVMPQTKEAINHAQAAKVPIIVAVNKMDKHGANPDRIKQQLAELGLQPEDWGGDTMFFPISALKGDGITELLDGILLTAEMKELTANPDRRAKGAIIESRQDRGRGVVCTVLVQAGTLKVGDIFVSGAEYGRVRTMSDHTGTRVEEVGPSTPVEITGLSGMPEAGDDFMVVDTEGDAREVATNRADKKAALQERALATGPISLEEFAKRANNQAAMELNVILKADVQGSEEAVKQSLEKLSGEKVKVRVLHSSVGGVNESDIQLAIASKAVVVGFGVRAEPRAIADAEQSGIEIRFYRIIYELLDDIKTAMVGLLPPLQEEVSLGRAEVRDTFSVPKIGVIAGCYVTGGTVKRSGRIRLLRDNRVIYEGKVGSLRRFKDDVKEVQAGFECGIGIDGFNDVKLGDAMEVYEFKEVAATLD